jgi:hypothetical protein
MVDKNQIQLVRAMKIVNKLLKLKYGDRNMSVMVNAPGPQKRNHQTLNA